MDQPFACKYCGKKYAKEKTLASHTCEPKRRAQQKGEVGVRLGYNAYLRFFEITQGGNRKTKTYEDFSKSPYYTAFVKFGRYMHNINAINPAAFTDWIIKQNKRLDNWTRDEYYNEYLLNYILREHPEDALERSVIAMDTWASENNSQVNHFFKYASTNRIVQMIANGRVSPWAVYCCDSGVSMLSKLNEEQVNIIYPWIDPTHWNARITENPTVTEWCKKVLADGGF